MVAESRLIIGALMIFIGTGLSLISLFVSSDLVLVFLIYGIPILIIGLIILLNKKEDEIEKRKDKTKKEKVKGGKKNE